MGSKLKYYVVGVMLGYCLFSGYLVDGQDIITINDLRFRHYQFKDGLPSQQVERIFEDVDGVLWMGTYGGLMRYDGYAFEKVLNGKVNAIFQDKAGYLWVGTNNDLLRYDPRTELYQSFYYRTLQGELEDRYDIISITQDRTGAICVGTANNGLFRYIHESQDSFRIYNYPSMRQRSLFIKDNISDTIAGNWLWQMFTDTKGTTWIGSGASLTEMIIPNESQPEQVQFRFVVPDQIPFKDGDFFRAQSISQSLDGHLWLGCRYAPRNQRTQGFYFKYNPEKNSFAQFIPDLNNRSERFIYEYDPNSIWIGPGFDPLQLITPQDILHTPIKDVYRIINSKKYPFKEKGDVSIGGNNVQGFLRDRSGSLWILSNWMGVYQIPQKINLFQHYQIHEMNTFRHNPVAGILPLDEDRVLVATWRNGVFDYNIQTHEYLHFYPGSSDGEMPWVNHAVFKDTKNRIWITSDEETISEYYPNMRKLSSYRILDQRNQNSPTTNLFLGKISEHKNGTFWMGSNTQGLIHFDPDRKKVINQFMPDQSKKNWIRDRSIPYTLCDESGNVWVSTVYWGLYKVTQNENGDYHFEQYLSHLSGILKLYIDSMKRFWISTFNQGLIHWDPVNEKIIKKYSLDHGLPSTRITDIVEGDNGWLWLLTPKGLIKFLTESGESQLYGDQYGIRQPQRTGSSMFIKDENLYVGGEGGFYILDLEKEKNFSGTPPQNILLDQLIISDDSTFHMDTVINYIKKIELGQNQNNFSIHYTGIHYDDPQGIDYSYRLSPYHEDWQHHGKVRIARLNNIPPGNYSFIVKAENDFGSIEKEVKIRIIPFWWNTLFAKLFYIILGLVILSCLLKYYLDLRKEKARNEQASELSEMRSRFFANISHEFKTPLTLIQGPIQDRLKQSKNPDDKLFFQRIEDQTQRMSRLVNELIDLSKLQASKLELNEQSGDVFKFLQMIGESYESLAHQKSIDFKIEMSTIENSYYFDKDHLEKIVNNLLHNAFNHTPKNGKIRYSIAVNNHTLIVEVQNSGAPIPEDELPHLFNQFYQASNAVRQGSGIGLALVSELVRIMNGMIDVSSNAEKGTLFTVHLPLTSSPEMVFTDSRPSSIRLQQPIEKSVESILKQKPQVLLVEDNEHVSEYIHSILSETYEVSIANNGVEGIKLIQEKLPEIIITDIMMPIMDGIEFCKSLKSNKEYDHIPVVMLTAKSDQESKLAGLQGGADYYLTKPFNSSELLLVLQNIHTHRERLKSHFNNSLDIGAIPEQVSSAERRFLTDAIRKVKENMDNSNYTIEQFASDLYLSRAHLHKKLKDITDQSPSQFVRNIRLEKAASLLKANYDNVSRIAYEVGFNNLSYFTKCFKEKYSVLPKDFGKVNID